MQARATAVGNGLVAFDDQREVALEELVGHVGEAGEQRVAIGAIAQRTAGDAAEADLEELEPLAVSVSASIEQVRRGREACGIEEFRRLLAEEAAEGVHFERAWLDPDSGKVFCLSNGPSKESVRRVHERAGHPTSEIYEVSIDVA